MQEPNAAESPAVRAITDLLRHIGEGDLPHTELFELKAKAFDLMGDQCQSAADAAGYRRIAAEARSLAKSR